MVRIRACLWVLHLPQRFNKNLRTGHSEKRSEEELQGWVCSASGSELESQGWIRLSMEGTWSETKPFRSGGRRRRKEIWKKMGKRWTRKQEGKASRRANPQGLRTQNR